MSFFSFFWLEGFFGAFESIFRLLLLRSRALCKAAKKARDAWRQQLFESSRREPCVVMSPAKAVSLQLLALTCQFAP